MCLAVPMQVRTVDGFNCVCEARGIEREVSLFMLQNENVEIGDHVLVHVGYAIQKVSEEQAADTWQLFDEVLAAEI
ncbi:MAG: HypC/HybG/HupF family hydrogenase formation chaperone [Woeseiaceae bacterium]|nr:HypC/HybG/HupF family hydrogenase formation chaperone [Woeseiaceae bacterium]